MKPSPPVASGCDGMSTSGRRERRKRYQHHKPIFHIHRNHQKLRIGSATSISHQPAAFSALCTPIGATAPERAARSSTSFSASLVPVSCSACCAASQRAHCCCSASRAAVRAAALAGRLPSAIQVVCHVGHTLEVCGEI